jgi:2-polyprenyl-6-methoxyphenol hydroxylase-like FAD-dependent oxidoreductase
MYKEVWTLHVPRCRWVRYLIRQEYADIVRRVSESESKQHTQNRARDCDRWVPHPARNGVVLVGDAAAATDPDWGTGLSLTLGNVLHLRECASADWRVAVERCAVEHDRYCGVLHQVARWFAELLWDRLNPPWPTRNTTQRQRFALRFSLRDLPQPSRSFPAQAASRLSGSCQPSWNSSPNAWRPESPESLETHS